MRRRWRLRWAAASILRASCRCGRIFMRWRLHPAAAADHVLLLVLHHIAGDGWSLRPLLRDLGALYRARRGRRRRRRCRRCRCSTPTTRCGSRRCWAMRAKPTARSRGSLRSGRTRCRSFRSRSSFRPTGRGPRCRATAAGMWRSRIDAELHRGLAALARSTGASLFMVLQAGLAGLLTRLGARHRHRARQPDRGAERCCARRAGRVLRQHAGAAHRHVGQSEVRRADRPGAEPATLRPMRMPSFRSSGWSRCSIRRGRCRGIRCSR